MNNKSTSPAARIAALAAALALLAIPARAEPVTIASAADWAAFAGRVNNGENYLDAKMSANVTLSQDAPFVGDDTSHPYTGTFDGDGHTLTVNWRFTDGTQWVAPFRFTDASTIQNLHVTGSLESNGKYVAGFIGQCLQHDATLVCTEIRNCRSSVTITCTVSGDATSAGFVGQLDASNCAGINLTDCLFDGSLLGPTASCCGGFTGYRPGNASAGYCNCLFAPEAVTVSDYDSYTFSRNGMSTLSNCYYMQAFGDTQGGTDASSMSAESLASALGSAWAPVNGRVALALFPPVPPAPAVNHFAYQGALKSISGEPLTGEQTVEFRLYDQATGGTPLWGRRLTILLNEQGLFNVELSDEAGEALEGTSSSDSLAAIVTLSSASTLYVGLTVSGSDGETVPRQRLLSVPYAVFAGDAANASGDFAVADSLFAAGLGVSGNTTISGNAIVKGPATVKGNLGVSGTVSGLGTAPVGAIVLWGGNAGQIPDGWALCNGQIVNGRQTPDLSGRFVVGYNADDSDYDSPGKTGGKKTHTLDTNELPVHYHTYSFKGADLKLGWDGDNYFYDASGHYSGNNNTCTTDSAGGGGPHENRPPYYTLCYIMRVK